MTKEKTNIENFIGEYADNEYPKTGDYETKRYGNDRMNEYVRKTTEYAIKLSNGLICGFEKPSIETRFCFHDEGPQYDLYKELHSDTDRMKNYFFYENLKGFEEEIEVYEQKEDGRIPILYDYKNGNCKARSGYFVDIERNPDYIQIDNCDREKILEVFKAQRENLKKRLETWWKRYGAEHLHTWTYWADA